MLKICWDVPPTERLVIRTTLLALVFAFSTLLLLLVADLVAGEVLISAVAGTCLRSRLTADPTVGFSFSPTAECLRLTADEGVLGEFVFFDRRTRNGVIILGSSLILGLIASWLTFASISYKTFEWICVIFLYWY